MEEMEGINNLTEKIITPKKWGQAVRSLTFLTLSVSLCLCVSVSLWQHFNWR